MCFCLWFSIFIATMYFTLLATFLSVLFCLLSLLTSDSRFDLVWFRLSCDNGWIRSGSVNVRKTTINNKQQCCIGSTPYSICFYHTLSVSVFFCFVFVFVAATAGEYEHGLYIVYCRERTTSLRDSNVSNPCLRFR